MPLWNDESTKRLLLAVITVTGAATHDWDRVVELMGGDYSKEGCRQQFHKQKRLSSTGGANGPLTPKKAKLPATPRSGRKRKQAEVIHDQGEDDEENFTPGDGSPKVKRAKPELEEHGPVKLEISDEQDSIELDVD